MTMGSYQYNPEVLKKITVPTLIIHGTYDLIFRPECAEDLFHSISGSKLVVGDGMGYSVPNQLYDAICNEIVAIIK